MERVINLKQRKRRKPMIILVLVIMTLGTALWGGITFNQYYNNPELIGTWTSLETGKEVEFTEKGKVKVDKVKTGEYIVQSPDSLTYSIGGHTFEMIYIIDKRQLVWGLLGEEETFERKGL